MDFYNNLKNEIEKIIDNNQLMNEPIKIKGKILSTEEAIGNPERRDFPLLKGKESLVEADFKSYKGQAFTDKPSNFSGTVKDINSLNLDNNENRAVFVSAINAIMNYLNLTQNNVHCRNEEPEICAEKIDLFLKDKYGDVNIGMVGLQPAMLDKINQSFNTRVLDLDEDNIGKNKYGVIVEHGRKNLNDVIDWADILLVTGSTIVNGTITNFIDFHKPVIFFGTTISGAAKLMNLERVCFEAK